MENWIDQFKEELPKSYIDFLSVGFKTYRDYRFAIYQKEKIVDRSIVNYFFSVDKEGKNQLKHYYSLVGADFVSKYFPIGVDQLGNLIFIDIHSGKGSVVIEKHEEGKLYFLAQSFNDFLSILEPPTEEEEELGLLIVEKSFDDFVEVIKGGVNPDFVTEKTNLSLAQYAARRGHLDKLKFLFSRGANLSKVLPMALTAKKVNLDLLEYCIQNGAKVNHIEKDFLTNSATALSLAFLHSRYDAIDFLMKNGAEYVECKLWRQVISQAKIKKDQKRLDLLKSIGAM